MPYHRIPMMMQLYRHLWRKQPSIWAIRMYVAVRPRPQVLTVLVLCAGYLPTAAYTICHEQPHRAFMTSVLPYRQAKRKRETLSFTGTYNSAGAVSHVGIYCGNGVMIHCGDPIKYASINTPHWQSHFCSY